MTLSARMQLRLTPYQHKRWSLIASLRGQSISEFVRSSVDGRVDLVLDVETRLERMIEHLKDDHPEAADSLRELFDQLHDDELAANR